MHRAHQLVNGLKNKPNVDIGETKQCLWKHMAQHWEASSSGQDSAVHLHLKEKGNSFKDVHVSGREEL